MILKSLRSEQMWIWILLAAALFSLLFVCVESFRECRHFCVTHYFVEVSQMSSGEPEKTLIFLSDLHNHQYGEKNQILIERIRAEKPDLILIGGDMLVGRGGSSVKPAADLITQLPAIAPVYCANGNHEQRMKQEKNIYGDTFLNYKKRLKKAGVSFLENRSRSLMLGNFAVSLSGLEIPIQYYEKSRRCHVTADILNRRIGRAEKNSYHILLAHNPVFFPAYKKWGADLTLSGHLHGGVVRIPKWRGIISPQWDFFPKYSGEMTTEEGHTIVVSKGLGNHTINIRLFNPPEVVAVHLRPCNTK